MLILLHLVTVELHLGILSLAWGCAVWLALTRRPTATLAALTRLSLGVGALCFLASMASGFFAWPLRRLLSTPAFYAKVFYSSLALGIWLAPCAAMNWRRPHAALRLRRSGALLATAGYGMMLAAASAGGHLARGGSLLDSLLQSLPFDLYQPVLLPWPLSLALLLASAILVVVLQRLKGL